jgi:hypothetical protein
MAHDISDAASHHPVSAVFDFACEFHRSLDFFGGQPYACGFPEIVFEAGNTIWRSTD